MANLPGILPEVDTAPVNRLKACNDAVASAGLPMRGLLRADVAQLPTSLAPNRNCVSVKRVLLFRPELDRGRWVRGACTPCACRSSICRRSGGRLRR